MGTLHWMYYVFRYGKWDMACEFWDGKPMLEFCRDYYNGWLYALHIGPFYIGIYY